jgi:alkanesulfonate monooxygenase SsuD/methylene tetrahydromethanopterin reductase-like flavin-dependent oxidoreductase (luciferase family)
VWVDPPFPELSDPKRVGHWYNWTLDEYAHAAKAGFDGICLNEHHQNAFGFMPGPNLMASALARETNYLDTAIVMLGSTLTTNYPQRVAEEYAMIDAISGGRIVAGMPPGSSMDANQAYGVPPIETRERFAEAHDLILKAWQAKEPFAFNGKYTKLPKVNLWPRPVQQPRPPVWIPGNGSYSTWEFVAKNDHCYCFVSFFGRKIAQNILDGYWDFNARAGLDRNPYRAGFNQVCVVGETDAACERDYAKHIEYFYRRSLHVPEHYWSLPGYQDYPSLEKSIMSGTVAKMAERLALFKTYKYQDLVREGMVVAGGPETVRDRLIDLVKGLRVGNLMLVMQVGSMPPELTKRSIDLFCQKVLPELRDVWGDEWENRWWPESLRERPKARIAERADA